MCDVLLKQHRGDKQERLGILQKMQKPSPSSPIIPLSEGILNLLYFLWLSRGQRRDTASRFAKYWVSPVDFPQP